MRSRKVWLAFAVLLLVSGIVVAGCGGASQAPSAVDGETLLEERCTECHELERTTSQQNTRAEWEDIVSRMVNRGARLDDEEQTVLVDYLTENYGP